MADAVTSRTVVLFAVAWMQLPSPAQVTTGTIEGFVRDSSGLGIGQAKVVIRHAETESVKTHTTEANGSFRSPGLTVGSYEVTAEKPGFSKFKRTGIVLQLNETAVVEIPLQVASVSDSVTVIADTSSLNTSNAEISTSFDPKRISELPLTPNRNVLMLAVSVPGVAQLQTGQNPQANVAGSVAFSVNGMRPRSNNFIIDGQDLNSPTLTGLAQPVNIPDLVAEMRVLTNQFAPEYGHTAGSVVNIITRSGNNDLHGSMFWFHNSNRLNARSNRDIATPFRAENQAGGAFGGPIRRNRTFFFSALQRWTDRRFSGSRTISGVPTQEGRSLLQSLAGARPTVAILLEHLPAAQQPLPNHPGIPLTASGRTVRIPVGTLFGSSRFRYDDTQWSARLDHRLNDAHTIGGRYLISNRFTAGSGQVSPPGMTTEQPQRPQAASVFLVSGLSPTVYHELRLGYQRFEGGAHSANPAAQQIPSVEVPELDLIGSGSGPDRTAIGLATDLPRDIFTNRFQVQSTLGLQYRKHSLKFGFDGRREQVSQLLEANARGRLVYTTLQDLVDDVAQNASINSPLPGGSRRTYFGQYDYAFFAQDQWRVRPDLNLTFGVRYESLGSPIAGFRRISESIVAAHQGDRRFALEPIPPRDNNNLAPRIGLNYRVPAARGVLGGITNGLVLRSGYARTYDFLYLQVFGFTGAFPLVRSESLPARSANALAWIRGRPATAAFGNPNLLNRELPSRDLRAPLAEQFSFQIQRELHADWLLSAGYIGTKGTALLQTVDLNPTLPGSQGRDRLEPALGVRTSRCNCTSSTYHSFQVSLEKRLSARFAFAAHYTWSSFIDGASDIGAVSLGGELPVAQDSFNRRADRGRSSYDRPHRLAMNGVFELPFFVTQRGLAGKLLGGWQASPFLTLQSGAPFSVLDGADPGFRLSGIPGATTVRANVNTDLHLATMSVEEILQAGGARLFSRATAATPLGNIGRNTLRSDGLANLDLGLIKNTMLRESHRLQFRAEFYNLPNTRNFGVPSAVLSNPGFLNQWAGDGGNRRILMAVRYVF